MRDTLTPLLPEPESPRSGQLRRSLFVGAFVALVTLALVVPPAAVGDGAAAEDWPWEVQPGEDSDEFPLVGELTFHNEDGERAEPPVLAGIDPELGLGLFWDSFGRKIRTVDTQSLEQLDVIDLPDGFEGPIDATKAALDTEHHRLFFPTSVRGSAPGEDVHGCALVVFVACERVRQDQLAIVTVSFAGDQPPVVTSLDMELAPEESQLQTRIPSGVAYHAPTDRVYVLTESGPKNVAKNVAATSNPYTTIHEFRAEDLLAGGDGESAEAVWSYQLNACETAVTKYGGFLARSPAHGFIYLPCEAGTGVTVGDDKQSPAMHGVLRIDLNLDAADPSDTSRFEERFHPFAANLDSGSASGNVANDLMFFAASSAGTNRLFTFDVHQEAWTGASALQEAGDVLQPTSNPDTGRIYQWMSGGDPWTPFRITEGNRVEVPNGTDYDLGVLGAPTSPGGFDPTTRRLFIQEPVMCLQRAADGSCDVEEASPPHFRVFEDRLPDAPPPEPEDFDERTEDVSEADGPVFTSSGANASAFGARYLFVGGTQTARPSAYGPAWGTAARSAPFGPAARQVIRAEVEEASLSRVTSTPNVVAKATGLNLGDQMKSDLKNNTERDWPEDFPEEMRGHEAYCDDFGGDPSDDVRPGAAVTCDAAAPIGQAGALYTATDEQAPVQIGYAETSVEVREDQALGAVTTVTAITRDIEMFGQISIGEIRTEATAVAHGRPGMAATDLTREYRQVRIGDSFACGWGEDDPCDIWEVVRAVNEVMQPRLVAYVPAQDTTLNPHASDEPDDQSGEARVSNATPGGARAIVTLDPYDTRSNEVINQDKRTELSGLQIVYYDDHQSVSRHIFQFAAVNLDVFYYISSAPTFDPPDWTNGDGGFGNGTEPGGGLPGDLGGAGARTVTPPPITALGEEPVVPAEEPELDSGGSALPTGDAGEFEADDGTSGLEQGRAPSLGTAEGPALDAGQDAPAPEVAPEESSGEQAVVAQGEQGGSSGPGGLVLTRQRMGETVPLAVLWVLAALPFYLAVRRRRLLTSSTR